jgi:hypothetical protein
MTFKDFKTSYQISKLIRNLDDEIKYFDSENEKIVKKYGIPNEDNENTYRIPEDKIAEANEEFQKLLSVEINSTLQKIDIDTEENAEAVNDLTPQDIISLEVFFNFL